MDNKEKMELGYEESVLGQRMRKIEQQLWWYDLPPEDEMIVDLVKRGRVIYKRMEEVRRLLK